MRRSNNNNNNNNKPLVRIIQNSSSHSCPASPAGSSSSSSSFISIITSSLSFRTMILEIMAFIAWLLREFINFWQRHTGPTITFTDNSYRGEMQTTVRLGRQIAEGGFSVIFECIEVVNNNNNSSDNKNNDLYKSKRGNNNKKKRQMPTNTYALKRVICPDAEILQACQAEANVHRAVHGHANLMPLLAMTIEKSHTNNSNSNSLCYMLFPLYSHSLRHEVNKRTLDRPIVNTTSTSTTTNSRNRALLPAPWSELQALQISQQIVSGVQAMHAVNYSHRDIKLENVLLASNSSNNIQFHPVLMDFGSAGPLQQDITTRSQLIMAIENATMHTTLSYRPPELLEAGGVRHGDAPLDYTAVDVWSLGCLIFALLYGASPKECEFISLQQQEQQWQQRHRHRSNNNKQRQQPHQQPCGGFLQIVECTPLRILNDRLPTPPEHSDAASWYSIDLINLITQMLNPNRLQRPSLNHVHATLVTMIEKQQVGGGGKLSTTTTTSSSHYRDDVGDDDDNDPEFIDVNVNDDEDHDAAAEMSLISHRV